MPTRSRQSIARLCIDVWVTVDGSVKRFDVAITSTDTRASDGAEMEAAVRACVLEHVCALSLLAAPRAPQAHKDAGTRRGGHFLVRLYEEFADMMTSGW